MSEQVAAAPARQPAAPELGSKNELKLQRKCACGQHTLAGGGCSACRNTPLSLPPSLPHGTGRRTAAAHVHGADEHLTALERGLDLSWVPNAAPHRIRDVIRPRQRASSSDALPGDHAAPVPEPTISKESAAAAAATAKQTARVPIEPTAGAEGAEAAVASSGAAPSQFLAADETETLEPRQMRKSEFLDKLHGAVCAAAEAALAGTEHSTVGCPYLAYWFDYYRRRSSEQVEAALHRYAPETRRVTSANEYIPLIAARVRTGVETWVRTGEITGVPEGIPQPAGVGDESQPQSGPFFMARNGGPRERSEPAALERQLGPGRRLDSPVRHRMESAFAQDFSRVRAHTGRTAARLSAQQNARAFTVGEHVAFGAGEYRPGTPLGDALIAHELAHVLQQRGGKTSVARMSTGETETMYGALETDADTAAAAVIASLWGQSPKSSGGRSVRAMPRLKSGLRLQRCSKKKTKVEFKEFAPCTAFDDTINPPALMVPTSRDNKAKAEITPASGAGQVAFESADRAKATVSPATASNSPQTVKVTGVAKGDTTVTAKKAGQVLASLAVSVKDRLDKTVEIHGITETNNTPNLVPANVPAAGGLQSYLNDTVWGKQANVFFTVTRSDKSVAYDLDTNGKLADPVLVSATSGEINAISAAAKAGAVDFNIYFINEMEVPHAFTIASRGEVWIQDDHDNSEQNVSAHELGHALGRRGESTNSKDVMFEVGDPSNPCEVRKRDWDAVNP